MSSGRVTMPTAILVAVSLGCLGVALIREYVPRRFLAAPPDQPRRHAVDSDGPGDTKT